VESTRTLKKDWVLTQAALDRFLSRLDAASRERAGEKYEILRLKLIKYFEWQNADAPEELADETINRAARKLAEGEVIENLHGYLFGAARHLASERRKRHEREQAALEGLPVETTDSADEEGFISRRRLECCESCLARLSEEKRELIVAYYASDKRSKVDAHKRMADALGISLNSLRIRAHRIRLDLEKCIVECENGRGAK
jgi:DNA-directed RNA polymerase specialized sigma24 family protein